MNWTTEKIRQKSAKELLRLLENCHRQISAESSSAEAAQKIIQLIEESGRLSESSSNPIGLPENDPKFQEMKALIESDELIALMTEACKKGVPALAPLDQVIQDVLGPWYGERYHSTAAAGGIVGEVLRDLGYQKIGSGKMPVGSVAKTASIFAKS